jgi:hypothetical protein
VLRSRWLRASGVVTVSFPHKLYLEAARQEKKDGTEFFFSGLAKVETFHPSLAPNKEVALPPPINDGGYRALLLVLRAEENIVHHEALCARGTCRRHT